MGVFAGHRLIKEQDGYTLLLKLDFQTEFAGTLGSFHGQKDNGFKTQVEGYIARNFPDIKINTVKITFGSLVVATLILSPIKTAKAAPVSKPPQQQVHLVQRGDDLYRISRESAVSIEEIKRVNRLSTDRIQVGQKLRIPGIVLPEGTYNLGDTEPEIEIIQRVMVSFGYNLKVDGIFGSRTRAAIMQIQKKNPLIKADGLYGPETRELLQTLMDSRFHLVAKPNDALVLVNKSHGLAADYVPQDLLMPKVPFTIEKFAPQKLLRKDAAQALEQLFAKAATEKIALSGVSGYRSFNRQADIFARNLRISPDKAKFSARPGESEHQTGLAIDVSGRSNGYKLTQAFAGTPEGQWLKQNAEQFGFVIRYPRGKEHVTGFAYEPWHIRYVGKMAAAEISKQGLTLEEYLAKK